MRRPGRWLRAIAARLCAKQTMDRVVDPIVADIQTDHEEALRAGRRWRATAIGVYGYLIFWKTVGLHTLHTVPHTLWYVVPDGWALGRVVASSLALALLLSAPPMLVSYSHFRSMETMLLLVPQAVPISVPLAVSLAIAWNADRARVRAREIRDMLALAIAATLFAFAAMLTIPAASQRFQMAVAEQLRSRGIATYSLPRGAIELSSSELAGRINEYQTTGSPKMVHLLQHAYHIRYALPAAAFVLSLLALGISAVAPRRTIRIAALIVGFGVYYLMLVASEPSIATLPPVVAVWAPNLVLTAVAMSLLRVSNTSSSRPA